MIEAVASLSAIGLSIGLGLGYAAQRFKVEKDPLIEEITAMLPGSQCGQCGYPGCAPAAEALARGDVPVTVCPPGGRVLAEALAAKLGVSADLSNLEDRGPMLARVREEICIGCTKCFKACPTDAIIGGPKQIHTVIKSACTGCAACIETCPTESLVLEEIPLTLNTWRWPKPAATPTPVTTGSPLIAA